MAAQSGTARVARDSNAYLLTVLLVWPPRNDEQEALGAEPAAQAPLRRGRQRGDGRRAALVGDAVEPDAEAFGIRRWYENAL